MEAGGGKARWREGVREEKKREGEERLFQKEEKVTASIFSV